MGYNYIKFKPTQLGDIMKTKMCWFNLLKCPAEVKYGCCELLGSFQSEEEAINMKKEMSTKIDTDRHTILIHKLEYEI